MDRGFLDDTMGDQVSAHHLVLLGKAVTVRLSLLGRLDRYWHSPRFFRLGDRIHSVLYTFRVSVAVKLVDRN